jgi:nucleoside-diphosphate-sugar epimerase
MEPGMMLVLGAGGFIGTEVLRAAAERGHEQVHGLVRTTDPPNTHGAQIHRGDARLTNLGLDPEVADGLRAEVTRVIISLGSVEFGASTGRVVANHVQPVRGALEFARSCRQLETVVLVSSIVAVGRLDHRVQSNTTPARPQLHNFYEWGKYTTEVLARRSGLPVTIVRPGHVMNASDGSTKVAPAPLAFFELLPAILAGAPYPTDTGMRYWSAPVDFVANVVVAAAEEPGPGSSWAIDPASPTQGEMLDVLAARHGIRARRLPPLKPLSWIATAIAPRATGYKLPLGVVPYLGAQWDLDFSCQQALCDRRSVPHPSNRDYVIESLDMELQRLGCVLP